MIHHWLSRLICTVMAYIFTDIATTLKYCTTSENTKVSKYHIQYCTSFLYTIQLNFLLHHTSETHLLQLTHIATYRAARVGKKPFFLNKTQPGRIFWVLLFFYLGFTRFCYVQPQSQLQLMEGVVIFPILVTVPTPLGAMMVLI